MISFHLISFSDLLRLQNKIQRIIDNFEILLSFVSKKYQQKKKFTQNIQGKLLMIYYITFSLVLRQIETVVVCMDEIMTYVPYFHCYEIQAADGHSEHPPYPSLYLCLTLHHLLHPLYPFLHPRHLDIFLTKSYRTAPKHADRRISALPGITP